jgi:hypothetical protein
MKAWAATQDIQGDYLVTLTDSGGKLRAYQIVEAIQILVARGDLDQLVVYFSGHGVHNRGDFWLLSGAPEIASEAVNVEGSIELARYCGIGHVVFISDACRTPVAGLKWIGITGTEIFPNDPVDGMERPVDAFFACARGKPALEVMDSGQAPDRYSGLYTEVLSECLSGKHEAVLEPSRDVAGVDVVSAWKLADELLASVPKRLKDKLSAIPSVNQTPVARICSRQAWISRVPANRPPPSGAAPDEVLGGRHRQSTNAVDAADEMLADVLRGRTRSSDQLMGGARARGQNGADILRAAATSLSSDRRSRSSVVSSSGICLAGATLRRVHRASPRSTGVDAGFDTVAIDVSGSVETVLLELDDGGSALVPVIADFITELTFEAGELAHVAFVPAERGKRWSAYSPHAHRIEALRASIGAAAGMGVFRIRDDNERDLASAMIVGDLADPSLALYLAYGYHEIGRRQQVQQLYERLLADFGFIFFDIALLSGAFRLPAAAQGRVMLPTVPLLARGWSLLKAFNAQLAPELNTLHKHLRSSHWTFFNRDGTALLIDAIERGGITL